MVDLIVFSDVYCKWCVFPRMGSPLELGWLRSRRGQACVAMGLRFAFSASPGQVAGQIVRAATQRSAAQRIGIGLAGGRGGRPVQWPTRDACHFVTLAAGRSIFVGAIE